MILRQTAVLLGLILQVLFVYFLTPLCCLSTGRKVVETTPTFLSPLGTESSKMVLRDEQLLLECIAAGL